MSTKCIVCSSENHFKFMKKNGFNYWRCCDCGQEFIHRQPTDIELQYIYNQEYYNTWGVDKAENEARKIKHKTFENRLNQLNLKLNSNSNSNILDCGCATGYFLDIVKQRGANAFGVEISNFGANICKEKFGENNVFEGQFENAKFENDIKFDAIFMSDYIEHVRNPKLVVEKAFLMLKPNGLLVITTPKLNSFSHKMMKNSWSQYKTEHLFYFSFENLKNILENSGFENVEELNAKKYLSFQYIFNYFFTYKNPIITPIMKVGNFILPKFFKNKLYSFVLGDMLITAKKL